MMDKEWIRLVTDSYWLALGWAFGHNILFKALKYHGSQKVNIISIEKSTNNLTCIIKQTVLLKCRIVNGFC